MGSSPSIDLVTCSIGMHFSPEVLEKAVRVLLSAAGRTGAKRGCRECAVARDEVEPGRVRYCEVWDSKEAFTRHLQGEDFRTVLVAMDLCREEPQVMVGDLTGQSGISYLRELRESGIPMRPGPMSDPEVSSTIGRKGSA